MDPVDTWLENGLDTANEATDKQEVTETKNMIDHYKKRLVDLEGQVEEAKKREKWASTFLSPLFRPCHLKSDKKDAAAGVDIL